MLLLHERQNRAQRRADIAVHRELERRAPAEPGRVPVDLDRAGAREEVVVGEVGAEQQQQLRLVHGLVTGAVAEQPAHPDVVGVVVLDPLLTPQRVPDRAVQLPGQLHHLRVGRLHPGAAEQRHGLRSVQPLGQLTDPLWRRRCGRAHGHDIRPAGLGHRRAMKHISGDRQHGHAAPT